MKYLITYSNIIQVYTIIQVFQIMHHYWGNIHNYESSFQRSPLFSHYVV